MHLIDGVPHQHLPDPHDPAAKHSHGHDHGHRPIRIGIGGPVGSGKTALVASLCREFAGELGLAVVTNDIYTTEDADHLRSVGVIEGRRIVAVETGCCPHTAIRDDISANLDALERLEQDLGDVQLSLIESGGDNLTAIFSRGLVDRQIFVLDTAGGDDVPRKGGPGVRDADLLVINKIDLAPYVGADTELMERDAIARRGDKPVALTSLADGTAPPQVAAWIREQVVAWAHPEGVPTGH